MLGHLVYGRYGAGDAGPRTAQEAGWMRRLLRSLFGRRGR